MFVLVVDTSLMNVSISAVVTDLGTTVSSVQSAIALEALVSAAFILISSKIGDLFGRKRAFIMGLLGYAIGAAAMVLANGIVPVIIFWAIIGGLGASLLLPSMQSLIHGNFEGAAQRRVYALVGAAAAIAAAIGPLVGGFITTFLSWRVGFALEIVVIAVVLAGMGMVKDVAYTGDRGIDLAGAGLSILGMGGIVLGVLVWQEGGEAVGLLIAIGVASLATLVWWLQKRKREGKPALIDPVLFASKIFRLGITGQTMQQIALGGMMIALPIFLQMVLEYNALQAGLSLAPLSLSMFFVAILAGQDGRATDGPPASFGWASSSSSSASRSLLPIRAAGRLRMVAGDSPCHRRFRSRPAGVAAQQLHARADRAERISEAAGVNSAGGSFGLSFGLAVAGAVMLATLAFSFTNLAESSEVLSPEEAQQVATALDEDAQLMSNTGLEEAIVGQPPDVEAEIIRINTEARPIALQVALLVPLIAGLIGLFTSFRMIRQPDVKPTVDLEGYSLG